jgi:8-oxo-dGTP pyrophosphatase MutT (NUDIX family)
MSARPRKQIGALPWRKKKGRVEVLLITSRETRRWVIPKGWPMDGLADFSAAKLEAYEEAGVDGRIRRKAIGSYLYDKQMDESVAVRCRVHVYLLGVTEEHRKWPEKGERKRQWFAIDEAALLVDEPDLSELIRSAFPY